MGQKRVDELEQAAGGVQPPMLVIHIRRTDKKLDGARLPAQFTTKNVKTSMIVIKAMIKAVERMSGSPFRSFFVEADDPQYFDQVNLEALQKAFNSTPQIIYNDYVHTNLRSNETYIGHGHT